MHGFLKVKYIINILLYTLRSVVYFTYKTIRESILFQSLCYSLSLWWQNFNLKFVLWVPNVKTNHNTKTSLSVLFLIISNHSYENGSNAKLECRAYQLYVLRKMDIVKNNVGQLNQLPSDLYGVSLLYTKTRVKASYWHESYYRPQKHTTVHTGSIRISVANTSVHNSVLYLSRPS